MTMDTDEDENPDRPRIRMATLSTGSDPRRLREVREALAWLDQRRNDPEAPHEDGHGDEDEAGA